MKKIFFLTLVSFFSLTTYAQDMQQKKIELLKTAVIQFINEKNVDSLYSLAGEGFKKQLNAAAFTQFCQNNLFPLGKIKSAVLDTIESGVNKYKTIFELGIFFMYLSIDANGKYEAFGFRPYKKAAGGNIIKSKTDNALSTELDNKIESIVQPFMFDSKTIGLSIGVLKDGNAYFYNYGETKKGNGKIPSSKDLYEIGSITKTFTGLLLAKAVIEKKMALNDPVNKYLPKDIPIIKFGNDTLRIVHLSNHTSGLPPLPENFGPVADAMNPYKNYDDAKLYSYLKVAKLFRKPGEKYEYCNLAAGLLGNILERVYKMPYEKLVKKYVCTAAGLSDTKQFLTKTDSVLFVQGYNENILPNGQWDFKALAAAGCLRSNTMDMLKYAKFNAPPEVDTMPYLPVMLYAMNLSHEPTFKDGQQQIGLNWFIQNWGWGNVLFHGGQTGGYKSFLAINPKTKNAVVILANTAISNDEIGIKILQLLDE